MGNTSRKQLQPLPMATQMQVLDGLCLPSCLLFIIVDIHNQFSVVTIVFKCGLLFLGDHLSKSGSGGRPPSADMCLRFLCGFKPKAFSNLAGWCQNKNSNRPSPLSTVLSRVYWFEMDSSHPSSLIIPSPTQNRWHKMKQKE